MYRQFEFPIEPFEYNFEGEFDDEAWESETNRNSLDYIRWVQQSLNRILGLRLKEDGVYGYQTRSAIRSFQQRRGLTADGIAGAKTEAALKAALGSGKTGSPTHPAIASGGTSSNPNAVCETLERFDYDRDEVKLFHQPQLDSVANRVIASLGTAIPTRQVRIIGHTDPVGPDAYNLSLGLRRAEKVRNRLRDTIERRSRGAVAKIAFVIDSRGESNPVSNDAARNRRVEICLSSVALPKANCGCIPDTILEGEVGRSALESEESSEMRRVLGIGHSLLIPSTLLSLPLLPEEKLDQFTTEGHRLIEKNALTGLVRQANCIESVYFGNWQRDVSQMFAPFVYKLLGSRAKTVYELVFEVLDVVAEAEFGRRLDRVRLGTYRWEEHIDNPREFCSPVTTCGAIDPSTYEPIEAGLRRPEDAPEHPSLGDRFWHEGPGALPNYLIASQGYVLGQLRRAAEQGPNDRGLEHFGNAMHTVEDFYAHSNFIELGLNLLGRSVDPRTGLKKVGNALVPVEDGLGRLRLTTGIFLPLDTVVSLEKLLLGAIEGKAPGTPPSNLQKKIIRVLVRRVLGPRPLEIYDLLVRAWEGTGIPAALRAVMMALGIPDLQRAFEEIIAHPLRIEIRKLLQPLVDATAQQTGGKPYPVVIGGRTLQVIETTHSKLSNDDPKDSQKKDDSYSYHETARKLAVQAVQDFWREMAKVWCSPAQPVNPASVPARFRQLIDRYMNHPKAAGDWWIPILGVGNTTQSAGRLAVGPRRTISNRSALLGRRRSLRGRH